MELREALDQISEIREQMAQTQVFRGYRSATTAFTGAVAVCAALAQAVWIPDPMKHIGWYLALWVGAAAVGLLVVAVEMIVRYRRSDCTVLRQGTLLAVEQFMPSVVAGGLMTFVMTRFASDEVWLLPGLWAMLFSLGVFASRRMLPTGTAVVAGFYLAAGLVCVAAARGEASLSPWAMGTTFGFGQFFAAGVLYWNLERKRERE